MIENQTLFVKGLNDFSSKYLKNLNPLPPQVIVEELYLKSKISEFLILHDKLSFKVFGENVPLIMLINWFGTDGVLELFKQNALEFVLWTPMIGYIEPTNDIKGIDPLVCGNQVSDIHCKPIVSAKEGFKWIKGNERPSKKTQKKIIRQVRKNTIVPPKSLPNDALSVAKFYRDEYKPKKTVLTISERKELSGIAEESIELSIAAEHEYSFWNQETKWNVLSKKFDYYSKANIIHKKTSNILKLEGIPDISKLVSVNKIPTNDIPNLRMTDDTKKFRAWIHASSPQTDFESVSQEYVKTLRAKYGFTGSKWFKPVRIASFMTLGGLIGVASGDMTIGALGSVFSGMLSDIVTSTIDQYIFEGIISGWKPQNFIEKSIRPYTNI